MRSVQQGLVGGGAEIACHPDPLRRPGVISIDSIVTVSPRQVACDLADEMVVLSLSNGTYYGLDPVAARIWSLLQTPQSVAAIRDVLLEEYSGVDAEQCTQDLIALLEQMVSWDLVQVEAGRP